MRRAFSSLIRSPLDVEDDLFDAVMNIATWQVLGPVGECLPEQDEGPSESIDPLRSLTEQGYFQSPPLFDPAHVVAAEQAVEAATHAGWPAVFAWLLDAPWNLLQGRAYRTFIAQLLGNNARQGTGIWAHRVAAVAGARGWGPHVDVATTPKICSNGAPERLTVWIALTDASLDNGCMHVVPSPVLASLSTPTLGADFDRLESLPMHDVIALLHHGRPLPALAGSVLGWRYDSLHWGGVVTSQAKAPRLSLSLEYLHQEGEPNPKTDRCLLNRQARPAFTTRLYLVGDALCTYGNVKEREPLAARFVPLGKRLMAAGVPPLSND